MNIIVIDTETANSISQPLCYDIGYVIYNTDTKEILVARSFVVAEIFLDKEMMSSAYYTEKCPRYWEDIKAGKRALKRAENIRWQILKDMKEFQVKDVYAYNMGFDKRSTNNGIRYITGSAIRWFFPYGTEFHCIWNMACTSILRSKWYIRFAEENGLVTEAGNLMTSAEACYRYITKDMDFDEDHTGLEDVLIELAIYERIIKSRMKYDDSVKAGCWRVPQARRKEIQEGD